MKKTLLICMLFVVGLTLLNGCYPYEQAYVPDYYGSYRYPRYSSAYYPYYYPYQYNPIYPYPAYYEYPAYYGYPAYYPYYYPYFGFGLGFSTVIIDGGRSRQSSPVFRGSVPRGGGGRTFRR